MEELKCRICGNMRQNEKVMLRGTMYGTHGQFSYFLCKKCGCLQICEQKADIEKYYDTNQYYSFNMDKRKLKNKLLLAQLKNQVIGFQVLGALVEFLYPVNYRYLKLIDQSDHVLDVGCGDGELIRWMRQLGFKNAVGIDPYVQRDIVEEGRTLVVKGDVTTYSFERSFRMITMIHSLEHIYLQQETIRALDRYLEPGGFLVIQLPVLSRYYWKKYGINLYTLDPPRHFYLHTRKSLQKLMGEFSYKLIEYTTEIDVAIPHMARNAAKGYTEKNNGTGFVTGSVGALLSLGLRKRLREKEDGAIATAVFQKTGGDSIENEDDQII